MQKIHCQQRTNNNEVASQLFSLKHKINSQNEKIFTCRR